MTSNHRHGTGKYAIAGDIDKTVAAIGVRLAALEKDYAVSKALLLAATSGGSFHPPAPVPATVPDAPTGVSATAGNLSASVTWTAPASNGGAAITKYQVTPYIGAAAQTAVYTGSAATSKTVYPLVSATSYTFKVAAINSVGTGAQSTASAIVTLESPPAPGAAFYISPTGSDTTGDGTIGNPWATIGNWVGEVGVDDAPAPGNTLYLRGGTYSAHDVVYIGRHDSGVDTNNLFGTAASPITIKAYPGETPVFSGGTGTLLSLCKATYLVIDGIQIQSRPGTQSGHVTVGQWPAAGPWGPADNITIKNCRFTLATGEGDNGYHPIYATAGTKDLTVEHCVFIGPGSGTESDGGYGFHAYEGYREAMTGLVCRYNIFDGWEQAGATIFGGSVAHSGSITHNTFVNCRWNIRIEEYDTVLVRDNAGETGTEANLMDDASGTLTADHNFWGQTFDANYLLVAGQTGRGAASDGTDAGALDW